jgi:hypothetical protein
METAGKRQRAARGMSRPVRREFMEGEMQVER